MKQIIQLFLEGESLTLMKNVLKPLAKSALMLF